MPTKNKRTAGAAAKEDLKKARTAKEDPKLAPVKAALSKVEHLPDACKQLLIAILAPSLGSSPERHEVQTAALVMIEATLEKEKSIFQERVSASEQKLTDLNSLKTNKDAERAAADAALAEAKEQEQKQKEQLAEASEAKVSAEKTLAGAQEARTEGGKSFEANKQEKEMLEKALLDHYKTPMDADECPHYPALQPHLNKLTIDDSLLSALPASCMKPKDQRGAFDLVVVEELGKAFSTKIAQLNSVLEGEVPAAKERDLKVQDAESDLEAKKAAVQQITAALEVAQKAVQDAAQQAVHAAKAASGAVTDVQKEMKVCDAFKLQLSEFEASPLATFNALKKPQEVPVDKVEAAEEVATAGA